MRAIDTNVLVRLVTRDDPVQEAIARKIIDRPFMLLPSVLMEAEWVLRSTYGLPRSMIADGLEMLLGHEMAAIINSDAVAFAVAAYRDGADLADMLHIALAADAGAESLVTFDKRVRKIGALSPIPIETLA
jgi:predicted nucleic-acid-binding protein